MVLTRSAVQNLSGKVRGLLFEESNLGKISPGSLDHITTQVLDWLKSEMNIQIDGMVTECVSLILNSSLNELKAHCILIDNGAEDAYSVWNEDDARASETRGHQSKTVQTQTNQPLNSLPQPPLDLEKTEWDPDTIFDDSDATSVAPPQPRTDYDANGSVTSHWELLERNAPGLNQDCTIRSTPEDYFEHLFQKVGETTGRTENVFTLIKQTIAPYSRLSEEERLVDPGFLAWKNAREQQ